HGVGGTLACISAWTHCSDTVALDPSVSPWPLISRCLMHLACHAPSQVTSAFSPGRTCPESNRTIESTATLLAVYPTHPGEPQPIESHGISLSLAHCVKAFFVAIPAGPPDYPARSPHGLGQRSVS